MRVIGVRELRQQASRYLRAVQEGETFEVTDRGRPVAMLVPVPSGDDRVEQLIASGRIVMGIGDALELGAPLDPTPGAESPSQTLQDMRAAER